MGTAQYMSPEQIEGRGMSPRVDLYALGLVLHEMLGGQGGVFKSAWPVFDAEAAKSDTIEVPVQVNGKLKGKFMAPAGSSQDQLKAMALALPELQGLTPKKVIVVPGQLAYVVV